MEKLYNELFEQMFAELMTAQTYMEILKELEHEQGGLEHNISELKSNIKNIAKEELRHHEILHNYLVSVPEASEHYKKAVENFQAKIVAKVKECIM